MPRQIVPSSQGLLSEALQSAMHPATQFGGVGGDPLHLEPGPQSALEAQLLNVFEHGIGGSVLRDRVDGSSA